MTTATLSYQKVKKFVEAIEEYKAQASDKMHVTWGGYTTATKRQNEKIQSGAHFWLCTEDLAKTSEVRTFSLEGGFHGKNSIVGEIKEPFRIFGSIRVSKSDMDLYDESWQQVTIFKETANKNEQVYKILKESLASKKGVSFKLIGQQHWEIIWSKK